MATTTPEGEGFLGRWSRLKRGAVPEAEPGRAVETGPGAVEAAPEPPAPSPPDLPPVESLGAGSDFAAFLAEGVPEELRRMALRKAWTSDPRIANFRGLAEYDWDFNAPGYGSLLPVDDIKRLCDAVLGRGEEQRPEDATPGPGPEPTPEPEVAAVEPPPADRDNGDDLEGCKTAPPALA